MREAAHLRSWLAGRDLTIPTVVAGDFNSLDDHRVCEPLRRRLSQRRQPGWCRVRAHLADESPDSAADRHRPHLVDGRQTATEFAAFEVPGTDHLGVQAVIAGT
ncbi:MAG: hypothetical protein R2742_11970 [Micropruina glycogenica]